MIFDLCKIDWTAIAAIISMVMVVATFLTLRQNRRQLKELKRQWEEQNRPYISAEIIRKDVNAGVRIMREFHLCITNIGNSTAYNTEIIIDKDYLQGLYNCFDNPKDPDDVLFKSYKKESIERFEKIVNTKISLQKSQRVDFHFVSYKSWDIMPVHLSPSSHTASANLANILWNKPIPLKFTYNDYTQREEVAFKAESVHIEDVLNSINNKIERIGFIYESEVKSKYGTK